MAIEVGTLVARLRMDSADFERGEASVKRSMTGMDKSAKSSAASIKASMQGASLQVDKMAASYQTAAAAQKTASVKAAQAEAQYNTVRRQSGATANELAQAEARFAAARARVATSNVRARETAVSLSAAQRQATADTQKLTSAQEASGSSLAAATSRAKNLAIGMGAGLGIAQVVGFLKNATMAASDLEESTNGVNTIFGTASQSVMDFASTASKSLGLSNVAAREAATTFGVYGKQAGLAAGENVKFSVKMATLAGDMASFKNTTPEDAIAAIGSAFRGESDPIEKYGVLLNESVIKNRALKDGLISTTSEALSPAVRVQAAYNEILAQTTYMQGDFAKTSDSLSNRLKTLRADFVNNSAAIGEKLTPLAQGFVTLLSGPGMAALSGFGDALGVVGKLASTIGSTFGSLPAPLQMAIGGIVAAKLASMALGTELGSKLTEKVKTAGTAIGVYGLEARGFATGLRQGLAGAFNAAGGSADGFGNKMRAAGSVTAGFARTVGSGLLGVMGGVPGILVAAATVGLGMWAQKSAEAKQHTEQVSTAVQGVSVELDKTGGKYSAAGQKAAAAALESIKLADDSKTLGKALSDAGISGEQAAKGLAGMGDAAAKTREELTNLHAQQIDQLSTFDKVKQDFGKFFSGDLMAGDGNYSDEFATEASKIRDAYDLAQAQIKESQEKLKREAAAGGDVVFSANGTAAIGAMSEAMKKFGENTDGAAAGVKILSGVLDQLMGDGLTVEDAMVAWQDGVQKLHEAAAGVNGPLFDMHGNLNAASESVRNFYTASKDAASNIHEVAAATFETTRSLQAVQEAVRPLYDEFVRTAQGAGIAQGDIDRLAAKLGILPTDVAIQVSSNFPHATELAEVLRGKVVEIPNDKTIIINDNSPEIIEKMKSLGYTVTALPGGRIEITSNAPAVGAEIDATAAKPRTAFIDVIERLQPGYRAPSTGGLNSEGAPPLPFLNENGSIHIPSFANGKLPSQAIIQRGRGRGLFQWAEEQTKGEAFIPMAMEKRPRSTNILREVADRFGYGLTPMVNGGITTPGGPAGQRGIDAAKEPNGIPYEYGRLDCSGYPSKIYNALTGRNARFTTDSDFAALGFVPGADHSTLTVGTDGGSGMNGHMAGSLFGTPIESGGAHGTVAYGGPAADETSFSTNTGKRIVWHLPRSEFNPPTGDDPSFESLSASSPKGRGAGGADRGGDGVVIDQDGRVLNGGSAGEGSRVFVTNWPSQLGGGPKVEERPARAKVLANFYANGGFEDHSPQITNGLRVFGEPETGGEAYIPLGSSKRPRSLKLWMETGKRLGVPGFAHGGFGGYTGPDKTDSMKPKNWYQGLALASGLAFTAASGLSGIASMAQGGNVDLSNLAPKFDTGSNSIPGLDQAFSSISQQLEELIQAARDGKPVNLQVDVDTRSGAANAAFMVAGL